MVQFNNILASVREQVVPTSSERKKLDEAIKELQILSRQATSNLPFKTHMLHQEVLLAILGCAEMLILIFLCENLLI